MTDGCRKGTYYNIDSRILNTSATLTTPRPKIVLLRVSNSLKLSLFLNFIELIDIKILKYLLTNNQMVPSY
jgi:hypothetical protein